MSTASSSAFDPEVVDQTRMQIRALVHEIEGLSRSEASPGEFYEGFLNRVVSALAAIGGAIWTLDESGRLKLDYQMNFQETRLAENEEDQQRHGLLLRKVANDGQGLIVAPHSGTGASDGAANPTDCLLVLAALKSDKEVQGVVEIFQRPGVPASVQRGYLRFLLQVCDLAGNFLQTRHLRLFADRQTMWSQLEQFTRLVHESLDPRQTAYTIANEGRRLIGCDRVTVALKHGSRCRVEAVSGQELIDQRSNTVNMLGKLATIVVAGGEELWYTGDTSNLPPQIEEAVETYADEAHSKLVAVIPLEKPREDKDEKEEKEKPPEYLGALVIEQITEDILSESMHRRIDVVTEHSALALTNAKEHHDLFLMPVWRTIGKSRWLVEARTLPKTISITAAVLVLLLLLFIWPTDFEVQGNGTLEPVGKRDVYVEAKGTVTKILVAHGDLVKQGQVLMVLDDPELKSRYTEVLGKRDSTSAELQSKEREFLDARSMSSEDRNRLAGQVAELRRTEESLEAEVDLLAQKVQQLNIVSPIDGQVMTWQIRERLFGRPVEEGQQLLTVADRSGDWELDIHMPDDRMGHVMREHNEILAHRDEPGAKQEQTVSYILKTEPGTRRKGTVLEIERSASPIGDEGNVVLIKAKIDKSELDPDDLCPGASVAAKVNCGRASLGYVWFHDVIAFIQSRVLFRWW